MRKPTQKQKADWENVLRNAGLAPMGPNTPARLEFQKLTPRKQAAAEARAEEEGSRYDEDDGEEFEYPRSKQSRRGDEEL